MEEAPENSKESLHSVQANGLTDLNKLNIKQFGMAEQEYPVGILLSIRTMVAWQ